MAATRASPRCAQRRFFTTPGPAGKDSVKGSWRYLIQGLSAPEGEVDAVANPSGGSPTGSLSHSRTESNGGSRYPIRFTGFVACVAVNGSRATVGAVGTEYFPFTETTRRATSLFTIDDVEPGTGTRSDRLRATAAVGTTPPSCTDGPTLDLPEFSSVVVTDN